MESLTYIRVAWLHDFVEEPVEFWSALEQEGYETRKVEIFRSGKLGYAASFSGSHGTQPGDQPMSALSEVTVDPQCELDIVDKAAFEEIWEATRPVA